MGKDVSKDIRKLTISLLIILSLLFTANSYPANEHDLFNSAYDYYLSYQPEKAIIEFKKFIEEFPNSSAKDAALFWLGKSLMHIGSYEEAEKVFNELKTEFSNSLYIKFANRELENIEKKKKVILAEKPVEGKPVTEKKEEPVTKKETPKLEIESIKEKVEEKKEVKKEIKQETKQEIKQEVTKDIKKEKVKEQIDITKIEKPKKTVEHIRYIIQAGTFKNKKSAIKLSSQLKKAGFKSYIIETIKDQTPLFIVTAGEFENRDRANESAKKIKKKLGVDVIIKDIEKILIAKASDESIKKETDFKKPESEKVISKVEQKETPKIEETSKPFEKIEVKQPEVETIIETNKKEESSKDIFIDVKKIPQDTRDVEEIKEIEEIEEVEKEKVEEKAPEVQTVTKTEDIAKIEGNIDYRVLPEEYKNILKLSSLWKTGNSSEDSIIEEELIKKAQKQNITIDNESFKRFIKESKFSDKQAENLYRELTIGKLIEGELKNLFEESFVELISVKYTDKDKYTKIVISPEIQNQAKSGKQFEEIHKMYPEYTSYKIITLDKLDARLKEKIKHLGTDEVGVTWNREGYTIMKIIKKGFDIKDIDNIDQKNREQIKNYIKQWIENLLNKKA